jgi:hypothetical protein
MPEGKLVRKPFLIHNLFPRGFPLWGVEKMRSQKHPRLVVIDEDGWLGTRASCHSECRESSWSPATVTAVSALCSPSLGRR